MEIKEITGEIIDAGIQVHFALGPGLLESAYEACLSYELAARGLSVLRQIEMPITYRGVQIDAGYRLDLIVEKTIIVELKAVREIIPIHEAQLLSYLKLSGKKIGLLLNFHVLRFKDGIKRLAN